MKIDKKAVAERVARGAGLLDEKCPGWRERVDPDDLLSDSPSHDLLSLIFGEYEVTTGFRGLGLRSADEAVQHGFTSTAKDWGLERRREVRALDLAWRSVLAPLPAVRVTGGRWPWPSVPPLHFDRDRMTASVSRQDDGSLKIRLGDTAYLDFWMELVVEAPGEKR